MIYPVVNKSINQPHAFPLFCVTKILNTYTNTRMTTSKYPNKRSTELKIVLLKNRKLTDRQSGIMRKWLLK